MKYIFTMLCLLLTVQSGNAQWSNIFFPNPIAFGVHDNCFYACERGGDLYRIEPAQALADTGLAPGATDKAATCFGSIGNAFLAGANGTSAGTYTAVFRSTNNGSSWSEVLPRITANCFASMENYIFAGGTDVLHSTDSGAHWIPSVSGIANFQINALAVSGTTLYAGTSSGVFRSTDLGQSWHATSMTTGVTGMAIVGQVILAGTIGRGIYRSLDNGFTWTNQNSGLFNHSITSFVSDGKNLFVGTGIRSADGTIVAGGDGVFMSTDSGQHWDTINYGLPQGSFNGANDFLSVNALGVFDTLLFVGVWDGEGVMNRTYVRSIPEILRQKGDTTASVVSEPAIADDSIKIYPNPTTASVSILAGGTSILGVRVLNVLGENVLALPGGRQSDISLDISKLPSGTYFLEIETTNGTVLRKVIRE